MSNDDFTKAARAEAMRRNPPIDRHPDDFTYPRSALREHKRIEFEFGAEWGRVYLAAQESAAAAAERAVRKLHREVIVYEHEDDCPNTCDEHVEAHHHEDVENAGDYYCELMPVGAACVVCRYEDGERVDWPCATIQALDSARRNEEERDG